MSRTESSAPSPLLTVRNLHVRFPTRRPRRESGGRDFPAVNNLSLDVLAGESFGLVGESGSGKTTLARAILGLTPIASGSIRCGQVDISTASRTALRAFRREAQMVFQDTSGSLNPRLTVQRIVSEPLEIHRVGSRCDRHTRMLEALSDVGLPESAAQRYQHELSGGQRQRVGIARAIVLRPRLLVLDEPVSALDVSIQAQVLNLLADLRARLGLTYLFVAHNLAVVRLFCDRVGVMYLGRMVEVSAASEIFERPSHPYTRALLSAVPRLDSASRMQVEVCGGDPPNPLDPPPGCAFHPRCPHVDHRCRTETPELEAKGNLEPERRTACHHPLVATQRF